MSEQDFQNGLLKIMLIVKNPLISKEKKRETLCKMVDGLDEETFTDHIPHILFIVNMKEEECRRFADANTQTDSILKWLPRMSEYREILYKEVSDNRKKCGMMA